MSSDDDLEEGLNALAEDAFSLVGLGLDGIDVLKAAVAVDATWAEILLFWGVRIVPDLARISLADLCIYFSALSATSFL